MKNKLVAGKWYHCEDEFGFNDVFCFINYIDKIKQLANIYFIAENKFDTAIIHIGNISDLKLVEDDNLYKVKERIEEIQSTLLGIKYHSFN